MIPLYDLERLRRVPYVTYSLIALNMLVFLWEMTHSALGLSQFFYTYGAIPDEITSSVRHWPTIFSSLFVHGNWYHLAGNMLFLSVFGDDVEEWLGSGLFAAFYLVCGVIATFAQVLFSPNSPIPIIGASGAIAGILGAYYVLFPETIIRCVSLWCFITRRLDDIAAIWVILIWFAYQVINALLNVTNTGMGGVAFFAHLGGFLAGLWLMRLYTQRVKGITRPLVGSAWGALSGQWANVRRYYKMMRPSPVGRTSYSPPVSSRPASTNTRPIDFTGYSTAAPRTPPKREIPEEELDEVEDYSPELEPKPMDMNEMEAELKTLREKVVQMPTKSREFTKPPQLDLSQLPAMEGRAQAMRFFNNKRGQRVQLETTNGNYYKGEVVSISSKQVFLRDENGRSTWIPLQDIVRVY